MRQSRHIKLVVALKQCSKTVKLEATILKVLSASTERLTRLVMLIAMAYVCSVLQGQKFKLLGQQKYINRLKELRRSRQRHSNFWVGLYGMNWTISIDYCRDIVNKLMSLSPQKLPDFQRGLKAMSRIQLAIL